MMVQYFQAGETMKHSDEKLLMWEAATLYYEKKYTQQEIAALMELSRQTVSKLLSDAVKEHIVEIKIHDPQKGVLVFPTRWCVPSAANMTICGS